MLNHMCEEKQTPGLLEIVKEVGTGQGAIGKLPLPVCFGQTSRVNLHKLVVQSQPAFGSSRVPQGMFNVTLKVNNNPCLQASRKHWIVSICSMPSLTPQHSMPENSFTRKVAKTVK